MTDTLLHAAFLLVLLNGKPVMPAIPMATMELCQKEAVRLRNADRDGFFYKTIHCVQTKEDRHDRQ